MKRKYSHIALAILLLAGSSGFTVNTHFCGELLKTFTINARSPDCCGTKEMSEGCCHDESQHFVVDDYNVQPSNFSFNTISPVLLTVHYFLLSDTSFRKTSSQLFLTSKSPPLAGSKIFIRIQSFLI